MANAVPQFYDNVEAVIDRGIWIFCLVLAAAALLHCLVQRAEAFPAIGTLSKPIWMAMIAGGLFLTVLSPVLGFGGLGLFSLISAGISAVYLLDVRPALRDAIDGRGSW